jgi:hypothetical protein
LPGKIGNASGANRETGLLHGRIFVRSQPEAYESVSIFEERHCGIERTLEERFVVSATASRVKAWQRSGFYFV